MAPPAESETQTQMQTPEERTESMNEVQSEELLSLENGKETSVIYCKCRHATLCNKCGIPMATKDATKRAIDTLINHERPPIANVFGNGPLLLSNVPESALNSNRGVVLGIDEAGRGCVLGSMVYGCAYWSADVNDSIPKGFRDSKQMKESGRSV